MTAVNDPSPPAPSAFDPYLSGGHQPLSIGHFISFEGGEGSGKSTQIDRLQLRLSEQKIPVKCVREPGGTPLGEVLRNCLIQEQDPVSDRAELFLFCAARAQLVDEVVLPHLKKGTWILADRFTDSTCVYQGQVRGLGTDWVQRCNAFATQGWEPELTFLLDIPAQQGLSRVRLKRSFDRIEAQGIEFHEKVRAAYHEQAQRNPHRFVLLNALQPAEVLADQIWDFVKNKFKMNC